MKLLHLAFLDGHTQNMQFFRKLNSQFQAMKELNSDTASYIIGDNYSHIDFSRFDFCYIDLKNFIFSTPSHGRLIRYQIAAAIIRHWTPDIVYCRYPWADKHLYQLVMEFPIFVFEHQTKEIPELKFLNFGNIRTREMAYGKKVLSSVKGIVAVTEDCLAYERRRANIDKPGYTMPNGIDIKSVPLVYRNPPPECINLLCLASFSKWHGYDRLIEGVRRYTGKETFRLHMVGTGLELNTYRRKIHQYSLETYFKTWGRLESDRYREIVRQCHLAVGSLALHRMGLPITSSLKNREYCAMGIPFCFSGEDHDFPPHLPFVKILSPDDEPIDIKKLLTFARQANSIPTLSSKMRDYAEKNLTWNIKIKGLLSFLETLIQTSPRETVHPSHSIPGPLWEKLLSQLENRPLIQKAPLMDRLLTRTSILHERGDTLTVITFYKEILEKAHSPKKYLFRILSELEKITPGNKDLHQYYAKKLLALFANKKRLDMIEMYRTASLYKKTGDNENAITRFEKLLDLDRKMTLTGGVYFHLGELYLTEGDQSRARKMFQYCCSHIPDHQKAAHYLEQLK